MWMREQTRIVACVCVGLSSAGCLTEAHEAQIEVSARAAPVIGGFEADSPKLNAVGSVSRIRFPKIDTDIDAGVVPELEPELLMACSGALLDARTVVTAKHCTSQFAVAARSGEQLVFALGAEAYKPTAYSVVIDVENAPSNDHGFTREGFDVGVLHLKEPLEGAPTVKLGALDASQIGQGFAAVGFGQADNRGDDSKRRLGALTLRALEGRTYELLLGSFDAYFEELRGITVPAQCVNPTPEAAQTDICQLVTDDRRMYEGTLLEQAGDMLLRGEASGSQPCYGDSGGPLLRANDKGELVAYGVVSGGVGSDVLVCDHGAIYARFVPEVMTFLEQAKQWQDPCAALPEIGECAGERARRCSTLAEGRRRVIEADCATLGLHCKNGPEGPTCE